MEYRDFNRLPGVRDIALLIVIVIVVAFASLSACRNIMPPRAIFIAYRMIDSWENSSRFKLSGNLSACHNVDTITYTDQLRKL